MNKWKGKTRGGVLGYQLFILMLKYLGINFAYFILYFVAFYYFVFEKKSSRIIYSYFRQIHHYSVLRSIISVYRNYYIFGQTLLDKIAMLAGLTGRFSIDFDGEKYLHDMVRKKTGGLLISAHLGNWEVAGNLLKRLEAPIHIVMYDAEHKKIKELLQNVTGGPSYHVIVIKDDYSHIFEIANALKNKEIVAIHADRFVEGAQTVIRPFMGKDARFPAGPFHLAMKYNVPVSFVFAMKERKFHYHFFASPPVSIPLSGNLQQRKKQHSKLLDLYVSRLEEKLKEYPLQWFNYYDFWM